MKTDRIHRRSFVRFGQLVCAALACALIPLSAHANSRTYTSNADFGEGSLFNVNLVPADQIQLNSVITALPVMWIANGGEDTVSKIDTNTGRETARYRTGFGPSGQTGFYSHLDNPWAGPAPSRTAVDAQGNVYVANRHFDNKQSVIVKILATGGIDRNGNSQIDTSSDLNNNGVIANPSAEIFPLGDANNNGYVDTNEIQDERIAWFARVGPVNGVARSLSIGTDGHLWVGLYNSRTYYKVSSVDGSVLAGPISVGTNYPYGSLVDSDGTLYGADLGNRMLRMNTTAPHSPVIYTHSGNNYGIALGNGRVYLANRDSGTNVVAVFNPATNTFSYLNVAGTSGTLGISVDGNGDIFLSAATSAVGGGYARGATKLRPDGSVIWTKGPQAGAGSGDQRGAIVDGNGDVWTVNVQNNNVSKFRGTDGASLGVFPVGNRPYTYSDATGSAFLQSNPAGNWTVVHDTGFAGVSAGTISWNALNPTGATVIVEVRAADTQAGLATKSFAAVSNGGSVPTGVSGRFWEVKVSLAGVWVGQTLSSPILYDLTISPILPNTAPTVVCPADVAAQCVGPQTLLFQVADADGDNLSYQATVNGNAVSVVDAGGGVVSVTHNFASSGSHAVSLTVSDGQASATCTMNVVIADTIAPVLAGMSDIVVSNDAGQCSASVTFAANASDNCGAVTLSYSAQPGSSFALGTTTVNVTATDAAGNQSSTSFTVTVNDTEAPALSVPSNMVVSNDPGQCAAILGYTATAADNCGSVGISYSIAPGSSFALGTTTVNVTATDAAGNQSSGSFTVTVNDTEAPAINCPANMVVGNDAGLCSAVVNYAATASDNCGAVVLSYSIASGTVFQKGTTAVTVTATDAAGNQSTCTFTVTVNDTEAPVASCVETNNPSGKNTPGAKSNAKNGQNPDGFYQLLAVDNCDAASALTLFVKDTGSNYISPPFKSGDKVKITQAPGVTPNSKPMSGDIVAHLQLKGDAMLIARDAAGNTSVVAMCRVAPSPR